MKNRILHIVLIFLFGLISNRMFGQFPIPDPNFYAFLQTKYPTVVMPGQKLNTTAAAAITGQFKCYNQNISNLSGVEYFKNITSLEVKYNPNLQSIPDISTLTQITVLGLDSNGLTSLPNLSSLTNLQILSVHHNQLTSIPSISALTQLTDILVYNNNLTSLPSLSAQVNLQTLLLSDNPLTSLPSFSTLSSLMFVMCQRTNISSIPSLSNCTQLQYIIITDNNVTSLPSLTNCPLLKQLKVFNCKLTSFPNLSSFTNLTIVNANNNELSFEDMIPSSSHPSFASVFQFNGQNPGAASSVNAVKNSQATLNLNIDNAVVTNSYAWYKDAVYVSTTTVNKLIINNVDFSNAGNYTCVVTNTTPSLSGIIINARPIALNVTPCIASNKIKYSVAMGECKYPISVTVDESSFTAGTAPYTYVLKNNNDSLTFTSANFSFTKEGIYSLKVKDAAACEVIFDSTIVVPRNNKCDPVFYPNGDGIADTYFIENTGTAKIYNKNGDMVKELLVPANWDGTDKNGEDAPTGLYVIIVGNNTIKVTILR